MRRAPLKGKGLTKLLDHDAFSAVFARREAMLTPNEVTAMLRLNKRGWGSRRNASQYCGTLSTVQRGEGNALGARFRL